MKTIYNRSDLTQFGINPLTGEACAHSMRILCDLSASGCALIADFLSLRFNPDDPTATFNKNWNSRVGERPAIASIMLSHKVLHDLSRFALFYDGAEYIIESPDGTLMGLTSTDSYCEKHVAFAREPDNAERGYQVWTNPNVPGGRNLHAMTGRTV